MREWLAVEPDQGDIVRFGKNRQSCDLDLALHCRFEWKRI